MTEHQIKGCQLLAEVEGLKPTLNIECFEDNNGNSHFRNYIEDWNSLHSTWTKIRDYEELPTVFIKAINYCFLYDKEVAFNALVEAAKWIKEQGK